MSGFLGNRALFLLLRMKFRGSVRKQVRRLKQPKHWIFLGLGALAAFSWIALVLFNAFSGRRISFAGPDLFVVAQLSMLFLFVLTLIGAFNYRGLVLPKEEIEFAFSAPITRSELVRYRLLVSLVKSVLAGLVFGLGTGLRYGSAYAAVGVLVGMLTVPLVAQGAALLLGGAENRLGRLAKHFPGKVAARVGVLLFVMLMIGIMSGSLDDLFGSFGTREDVGGSAFDRFVALPVVRALLLPFTPWAHMISARNLTEFAPYFAFAVGFWLLLFEAVVRIRVDFRELSLATSADVAKHISRIRKGNLDPTRGHITKATIGWRVPWFFGTGAFGAVAWNKTTSIVRKSRGTLVLSILIITFLTVMSTFIARGRDPEKVLIGGSAFIAAAGTIYMCAGLRFDFRMDLDLMDRIKTWPLAPWRIFLATILPEVMLVSTLIVLAVTGRALWLGSFHPAVLGILAFQPLATLTWVALDNAVFLFSPIRYTPGEEGALQNMGRTMLLMLLRMVLLFVVVLVVGLPAALLHALLEDVGGDPLVPWIASGALAWVLLLGIDGALIWLGGKMLQRFDVARDRPV